MENSYICSYVRTPIGAFQGSLSKISATSLGAIVINEVVKRSLIDNKKINEVIMGNVLSANLGQAPARQACIEAGLDNNIECYYWDDWIKVDNSPSNDLTNTN